METVSSSATSEGVWTAGAVARMLDVPPSTLRGWHRRYLIPASGLPAGTGAHRRYTDADVAALTRMRHLIGSGVSAGAAAKLAFEQPPARPDRVLGDGDVRAVVEAARRLDAHALVTGLDARIAALGVVQVWNRLCCPALNALGGTDAPDLDAHVDVVQVLSWAIAVALHRVAVSPLPSPGRPVVLLGCVQGERHTLPLEALRAALAQAAVPAHLLGGDLPRRSLSEALQRTAVPPAALVLWAGGSSPAHDRTARSLAGRCGGGTRFLLAGPGWATGGQAGASYPATLEEAVEILTRA
ncbi:MerR family transcriptional regulator [Actinomycetes bacterium KLBMP 9759]